MMLPLMPLAPAVCIAALDTVFTHTKAEPAVKSDVRINNAEAWLASVVADMPSDGSEADARRRRCAC
jgi:hypothetical protein